MFNPFYSVDLPLFNLNDSEVHSKKLFHLVQFMQVKTIWIRFLFLADLIGLKQIGSKTNLRIKHNQMDIQLFIQCPPILSSLTNLVFSQSDLIRNQ